jgi:RHH-type proline utilization regulon transcriptional repressor/proline dehydrogenase/delta 1-pyrroline-5-carboxylate dehydrogenase
VSLVVREGRRTYGDAVAEVREAADFCRYYALQARLHFSEAKSLPGPAGERNELSLNGRGVFACISPWNFPLAIFTGQVAAALAAGNTVIAKPAEQTPRTGLRASKILYEAGIPPDVAALRAATADRRRASRRRSAHRRRRLHRLGRNRERINQSLAARQGRSCRSSPRPAASTPCSSTPPRCPSRWSTTPSISAFQSAGQRCSAQRILFVEGGAAPRTLELLRGALAELKVGDPPSPTPTSGPVIDAEAHAALRRHIEKLRIAPS